MDCASPAVYRRVMDWFGCLTTRTVVTPFWWLRGESLAPLAGVSKAAALKLRQTGFPRPHTLSMTSDIQITKIIFWPAGSDAAGRGWGRAWQGRGDFFGVDPKKVPPFFTPQKSQKSVQKLVSWPLGRLGMAKIYFRILSQLDKSRSLALHLGERFG
jgi:hypothetical protein